MKYIYPANDAAQSLQEGIASYLRNFDNPLIRIPATAKTLAQQHASLLVRLEHMRFCLSLIGRRLDLEFEQREIFHRLWDSTESVIKDVPMFIEQHHIDHAKSAIAEIEKFVKIGESAKRFLGNLPKDTGDLPLHLCRRIIEAIMQDELDVMMKWREVSRSEQPNLEKTLIEIFPKWEGADMTHLDDSVALTPEAIEYRQMNEELSSHFYKTVLDEFVIQISQWLNVFLPFKTWNVWYLRTIAGGDLMLESGEDFRAMDWERRIRSGEWVHDKASSHQTMTDTSDVPFDIQNEKDIQSTIERLDRETRAGFNPRLFRARLNERPQTLVFAELSQGNRKTNVRKKKDT